MLEDTALTGAPRICMGVSSTRRFSPALPSFGSHYQFVLEESGAGGHSELSMVRRVHLITNPKGGVGNNMALAEKARTYLENQGLGTCLHITKYAGHGGEILESLECAAGDAICGIGGDGTMHELVNGMMRRDPASRIPLTLLPGGTGNAFLRDLNCLEPAKVLERIVGDARRFIDLFAVTVGGRKRYGFNIVGWGLFSSGNRLAESLRVLGRRRYDIAGLLQVMRNRRFSAMLEADGKTLEGGFTLVVVSNTMHTGEGMKLAPRAKLDDGKLDLIYVKEATRRALFRLFAKLGRGTHVDEPGVHYMQVSELKLITEELIPVILDGELIESGSFDVRVLPGALELLI